MKALEIKTTAGPNYWSVKRHKLVVITLDIEELEQRPTHLIPGFTNGKTTTTRLIAHIAKAAGYTCGCSTTDGIYINNRRVVKGDCAGPLSALTILTDPGINIAVLECARGGILRSGLAFDRCDVGIVTNIGFRGL